MNTTRRDHHEENATSNLPHGLSVDMEIRSAVEDCGGENRVVTAIRKAIGAGMTHRGISLVQLDEFKRFDPALERKRIAKVLSGKLSKATFYDCESLVLSLLSYLGIQLSDVITPKPEILRGKAREYWEARMEAGPAAATGSMTFDPLVRLRLFIQFQALHELCS